MKILAIETSCDETAAAVMDVSRARANSLSSVVSSQIKIHQKTHGVVPEVAARAHVQKIRPVVEKAINESGVPLSKIDHIAVTTGPGLASSLVVGVEFARALAYATGKPLLGINHMLGHLYSPFYRHPELKFPSVNLTVSGGHTYLILLKNLHSYKVLGSTVDDAAGEAFDKVARMLDLQYPGGPEVSKAAARGKHDFNLPRPMIHEKNFNFSFAGLKTAVMYLLRDGQRTGSLDLKNPQTIADVSFSFQNAAVDVLITKTIRAAQQFGAKSITLAGGVAANKKLRDDLALAAKKLDLQFSIPDFQLCTDNAVMIGNAAAILLAGGMKPSSLGKLKADPNLDL
jgi:N6-L-threonylcarbamoyladenine synthase